MKQPFEHEWVVYDYMNRMTTWLALKLAKASNKNLKGWRFRFIFDDSLEMFKAETPVEVFEKKKIIVISMMEKVYVSDILKTDLSHELSVQFAERLNLDDFKLDTDVTDSIDCLLEMTEVPSIGTFDYVIPIDTVVDTKELDEFCKFTMSQADGFADCVY